MPENKDSHFPKIFLFIRDLLIQGDPEFKKTMKPISEMTIQYRFILIETQLLF
jgi:hypothetical protein